MSDERTTPGDPEYLAYLQKYINPPPSPKQAAIQAEAEQHVLAVLDTRRACEEYNEANGLAWINWELPTELRERIDRVLIRIREAMARDSRSAPPGPRETCDALSTIWYYDNRNKYYEQDGWPAYDPDNPHHQTVPFGTSVAEPDTLHVLRGGTAERVVPPSPGHFQRPSEERRQVGFDDDPPAYACFVNVDEIQPPKMPHFGHGNTFENFFRNAENVHMLRWCDMRLPDGCENGIGGGDTQLVAVPLGQHAFVLNICAACMKQLRRSYRRAHPKVTIGTVPPPMSRRKHHRPGTRRGRARDAGSE